MKTEVMSFRDVITPGQTQVLQERIKDAGRVSEIRVRFYPGQQKALQVRPYAALKNNRTEDVLTYVQGSDPYLSGDDDYLVFPVSLDLTMDDNFCVWACNTDGANAYSLVVDVIVQYYGDDGML